MRWQLLEWLKGVPKFGHQNISLLVIYAHLFPPLKRKYQSSLIYRSADTNVARVMATVTRVTRSSLTYKIWPVISSELRC